MSGDLTNSMTALTASSFASFRVLESSPVKVAKYLTKNVYESFVYLKNNQFKSQIVRIDLNFHKTENF